MSLDTALRHLAKAEWEKAHDLVQNDESALGCWAHGIVHLQEGDTSNARYWYRRAGRSFSQGLDLHAELTALAAALGGAAGS